MKRRRPRETHVFPARRGLVLGIRNISSCRGKTANRRFPLVMVDGKNMACLGWKNRLSCLRSILKKREAERMHEPSNIQTVCFCRQAFYGASLTIRRPGGCEDGLPEVRKLVLCKAVCQKIERAFKPQDNRDSASLAD